MAGTCARLTVGIVVLLSIMASHGVAAAVDSTDPAVTKGLGLLTSKGCTACHTTDGRRQLGPTFLGYFGSEIVVTSNGTQRRVRVDAAHVRRAVRDPNADVPVGFPPQTMPTIKMSESELDAMVAALRHLSQRAVVAKRKRSEGSIWSIVFAVLAFVFGHLLLSSVPVRTRLIGRFGDSGFMGLYSLFATAVFVWTVWAYIVAPYVPLWTPQLWTRWVPLICMPVVMILMVGSFVPRKRPDEGLTAITRHPQLWAQGIWGLCHLPPNGDLATVMLFGGLSVLSFAGIVHIELRKRKSADDKWTELCTTTSVVPFVAMLSGRNRSAARTFVLPVAIGTISFVGMLYVHELLIGKSGFPY